MKDYYEILQVSPNAEPEVIEAAYRRLARKYHPDVNRDPTAADRMRELNEAYEAVGDPRRRAEYDAALGRTQARAGARTPQQGRPSPPPPPPPPAPPPPTEQRKEPESSVAEEAAPDWREFRFVWLGIVRGLLLALAVAGGTVTAILIVSGQWPETTPNSHGTGSPAPAVAPTAAKPNAAAQATPTAVVVANVSADDDPSIGPEDAPVTIVMFTDFQ